jgi:hypothetical protein
MQSARMMWRTNGAGELYAYVPQTSVNAKALANGTPKTNVAPNDVYGTSVGRGSFTWKTGAWTSVSQRVKLNTVGKADGEIEISVNGKSTISVTGLELRTSSSDRVRGMQIQTFFGGGHSYCYFLALAASLNGFILRTRFDLGISQEAELLLQGLLGRNYQLNHRTIALAPPNPSFWPLIFEFQCAQSPHPCLTD